MKDFLKKAAPYLISAAVGLIIFIIIICTKKIWDAEGTAEVMRILSDASFVPGVLLAGFGLILVASNGGLFDMLAYSIIRIFDLLKRDPRNTKYKDFYEYREARKGKKRSNAYLLLVGITFIFVAAIFLIVYMQYSPDEEVSLFFANFA